MSDSLVDADRAAQHVVVEVAGKHFDGRSAFSV